jgi:TRAP-type C4-dicarboxylate transport system permease small subunit
MMLWVALLGASMATFERAHLSLEMGEKIWPSRWLHVIKAAAHAVTSAFCIALLLLSIEMVTDQMGWEATIKANDWLPSWVALAILPYTFAAMSVRLLAQTYTVATRRNKPVDDQLPT